MYDSVDPAAIPNTAAELLVYTDGDFANEAAMRARFPNAVIHTISTAGHVVAEWIDVEPGAVWPNQAAADLFRVWRTQGCRGYYTSLANEQALREAHAAANPGVTAEWFDADWTNTPHVDPGNVATQYADPPGSGGSYDVSDTTPQFEGVGPPSTGNNGGAMIYRNGAGAEILVDGALVVGIPNTATAANLPAGIPVVNDDWWWQQADNLLAAQAAAKTAATSGTVKLAGPLTITGTVTST